jgi:transposase-like protein
MYAKGMTTRDIQAHLQEIYGVEVSPSFISLVTERMMTAAYEWQNRALQEVYTVVYFDALFFKVRSEGRIISKAVYNCVGIDVNGNKDVLGLWICETEGASYWITIMNELKARGIKDIFIACIDGLTGLDNAIRSVFPKADLQRCIIHMIRSSTKYGPSKHRAAFLADLKNVYTAVSKEQAEHHLSLLLAAWEERYPLATKPWLDNWDNLSSYFKYPQELRRIIYTTNAVEAVNRQFRKVTKTRSILPNDAALFKLLYLAVNDIVKKWSVMHNWADVSAQLYILFKERYMPQ